MRTQVGKPGAYSFEQVDPELAEETREELETVYREAYAAYARLVEKGVARELARSVIPVGAYTQFYWTVNARALMNFVSAAKAEDALKHVKEDVFPFIKTLGGAGGSFAAQMENAEFKINKPSLLIEACKAIDAMQISAQNQDVQGDLYEYLLSKLNTAGHNGQFRTPRHIIRMMVKMVDPQPGERICDPAAGTCGFLVNAYQHILETHTDPRDI